MCTVGFAKLFLFCDGDSVWSDHNLLCERTTLYKNNNNILLAAFVTLKKRALHMQLNKKQAILG